MNRLYLSNNKGVKFSFNQTPTSFKVVENINYKLHKRGEYRLLKVTKVSISTIELIEYLASVLKIKESDIGYAGLKDKHATTTQYLTIPKYVNVKKFKNSDRVRIEELGYCVNRLRVGELLNNSFEILLEDVTNDNFKELESAFNRVKELGFANFFGYQRFGILDDAALKGKKISNFGKGSKNQKSKILIAAYQAKLFNLWLNRRLEISKAIIENKNIEILKQLSPTLLNSLQDSKIPFKLLQGDLGYFYKKGKKIFKIVNNINKYIEEFDKRKFHPTGVLYGNNVHLSTSMAKIVEKEFIDYSFNALKGARRAAWVWPIKTSLEYNKDTNCATVKFTLPPGSYATVLLEELLNKSLTEIQ